MLKLLTKTRDPNELSAAVANTSQERVAVERQKRCSSTIAGNPQKLPTCACFKNSSIFFLPNDLGQRSMRKKYIMCNKKVHGPAFRIDEIIRLFISGTGSFPTCNHHLKKYFLNED